jgi:hypothetical protein
MKTMRKKKLKQKNEDLDLTDYTINNELEQLIFLLYNVERRLDTKIQTFVENFIGQRF